MNWIFISLLKETYRTFICSGSYKTAIIIITPCSIDLLFVSKTIGGLYFWCWHIFWVLMKLSHCWQNHLRKIDMLRLSFSWRMCCMETFIDSFCLGILSEWKPLESKRRPFEFVKKEPIIKEASILHPNLIITYFLLVLFLHGANWLYL